MCDRNVKTIWIAIISPFRSSLSPRQLIVCCCCLLQIINVRFIEDWLVAAALRIEMQYVVRPITHREEEEIENRWRPTVYVLHSQSLPIVIESKIVRLNLLKISNWLLWIVKNWFETRSGRDICRSSFWPQPVRRWQFTNVAMHMSGMKVC